MKIKSLLLSTAAAASLLVLGATAANADTITVKAGDTVSALAETHHTTISAIESANSLANVNLIYVGQQLEINGVTTPTSTAQTTTNVQAQSAAPQSSAPASAASAASQAPVQSAAPQSAAPVQSAAPASAASAASQAPAQSAAPASQAATSTTSDNNSSAKAWIANKESGGSYSARNGQYIGKYQLSSSYLNGDYSAANQERVAENYVANRYGSWAAAQSFWQANGWY
ncbi:aggregation-promoting factor [Lactiplantibacillus carotarum]|uniref:aggregation-promoting factor n=1 Tax=Lactiplantibacillus carotarum TaxID=2993456 RepID=UPI00298F2AE4|nr:LysM domain-containing protein [Lactiplantibacillus carotarum]